MYPQAPIKRILLPLDFSEYVSEATHYACGLADAFDSELHLLHVLESHAGTPIFGAGLSLAPAVKESPEAVVRALRSALDPDWKRGHAAVFATADGPPFVEIVKYARAKSIDMIVLGTHGRSGVAHLLLGSVAENVIRNAPCPVLAVPSKRHTVVKL